MVLMRIIDKPLLAEFRPRRCDWCNRFPPCQAAHVFGKGMGGARRLDIRINLCSLCPYCHYDNHQGKSPTQDELLVIVAKREHTTPQAIREEIWRLRRL
jgi:hypothetical protein